MLRIIHKWRTVLTDCVSAYSRNLQIPDGPMDQIDILLIPVTRRKRVHWNDRDSDRLRKHNRTQSMTKQSSVKRSYDENSRKDSFCATCYVGWNYENHYRYRGGALEPLLATFFIQVGHLAVSMMCSCVPYPQLRPNSQSYIHIFISSLLFCSLFFTFSPFSIGCCHLPCQILQVHAP